MARLRRILATLRWRGVGYLAYLVTGCLAPRLAGDLFSRTPLARLLPRPRPRPSVGGDPAAPSDRCFLKGETWLLPETWRTVRERQHESPAEPVVLGRIDNDGRILALCGPIPDFEEVSTDEFVERYRYDLDLVLDEGDDGVVLIRKGYRGDRAAFLRESASLAALRGTAGPGLYRGDEETLQLFKAFLPGPTLRQRLAQAGARILSVDTETDPELLELDPTDRLEAVWARGRARFGALPAGMIAALERQLDAVHRRGVTGFSLTYGNVVLVGSNAEPRFLDFDSADVHSRAGGLRFVLARDRDRRLFHRIYGSDLLTECSARATLRRVSTPYSPIDLGRGLVTRGFWSVDSGTGRWEFLNGPALRGLVEGRRILDLGSFNALMPMLMLAAGARQVVAVERSSAMIPVAEDLRRLFEWRDMRPYDLDLRCADMRAILDSDWGRGRFDLVTAFCSLYYLDEDDMGRVVRRAAELAPVLVIQAKTDTRPAAAHDKALKSSLTFLRPLLERNGFPSVEVIAPPGYSRPLLIGRKSDA